MTTPTTTRTATSIAAPIAFPPAPRIRARPRLRRIRYEAEPGTNAGLPSVVAVPRAPVPVPNGATPGDRAEAHRAAVRVLRLALEVLDGRRPITHLAPHVDATVLRYWRAAARQRRVRSPARFARLRVCLPRSGVAEVAAACHVDGRVRALAARFERTGPHWRCTAVRLG